MATLTAYRMDEEPQRMQRLVSVESGIARARIATEVLALHDHKGVLFVNWASTPTTKDIIAIANIWQRRGGEGLYEMNHYVRGRPLLRDVESHNPFDLTMSERERADLLGAPT